MQSFMFTYTNYISYIYSLVTIIIISIKHILIMQQHHTHTHCYAFLIVFLGNFFITNAIIQCDNSTTHCPTGGQCCQAEYSPTTFGCKLPNQLPFIQEHKIRSNMYERSHVAEPPHPTVACCMPGPDLEPSNTLPNTMILGDSVSIGYTGYVAKNLNNLTQLQHSPWDEQDGGAGATSVGVACLDNFLKTQRQTTVKWDLIMFNFGLHDLDHKTSSEDLYKSQLLNITNRLMATGAKLMFALTTPFMPLTTIGDTVVADLNRIATEIMTNKNIPILDLHKVITDHCGELYTYCDWCRKEPCSYHYNQFGYVALGNAVIEALKKMLEGRNL